ncbi:unnamed protein product [Leptidea sinapis]|uniref:Sodium-dependent multivitamin transporter n=1 Tax=Leptidea sinapis TaxID=189913 RepID=A0A5E4QXS0_9NEOP|nr:unnamed protein product [Leptidea sinapis]
MVQPVFGAWDYTIMAATMVLSVAIGVYFRFSGGKQKTNENYYYGMIFIVINFSYGIATPICSHLYLPVFFGLQKTSTYEYLELRFGPRIRMLASLTYTLQMILYNGIVLYAPAIVLEAVTGLDRVVSILVVGLACTFYSTLGGMKAVLFTDLLQSLLMWCKIKETYISWLTKLAACGYGLLFLALAFLAEYLGGVLQAALTIFGAVGGPLLGGVSVGLLSGMAFTLWMSFGGPRPPTVKLPVSVDGCAFNVTVPPPVTVDPNEYFYLYRISYMWTSPQQPWQRAGRPHPDPALFTPPLAHILRTRLREKESVQCELLNKEDIRNRQS